MTTAITAPAAAIVLKLPAFGTEVSIGNELVESRNAIVAKAQAITAVTTSMEFNDAGDILQKLTKVSNAAEADRKRLAKPFQDTAAKIKDTVDGFRAPLEAEKERVKGLLNAFAQAERDRVARETREAEERQRQEIERQLAQQEIDDELGAGKPQEVVVIPPAPVIAAAPRADSVKVPEVVEWELTDEQQVPVAFKTFDPRKVNEYVRQNKDLIKARVADGKAGDIVPGVRFVVRVSVSGR